MSEITKLLQSALVRKMKNEKLTQETVTKATGVTKSTISRIVNLKGNPDAENVVRLAEFCNLPLERVMGESDAAHVAEIFRVAYVQFSKFEKRR